MLDQDGGRRSSPRGRGDAPEAEMADATYVPMQGQIQPGWAPDTYSSYPSYNPYGSYFENFENLGVNGFDDFVFGPSDPPLTSLDSLDGIDAGLDDLFQDFSQPSTCFEQFTFQTVQSGTTSVSHNVQQSYSSASSFSLTNDASWFSTTPRAQESGAEEGDAKPDSENVTCLYRESPQPAARTSNTSSPQLADSPPDDQDIQAANSLLSFGQANMNFDSASDAAEQLQQMSRYRETVIESIEKEDEPIAMRTKERRRRAPSAAKNEASQALEPARKKARKTYQKKGKGKNKELKKATSRQVHQKKSKKKETSKEKSKKIKAPAKGKRKAPMKSPPARNVPETNRTRLPSAPRPGAPSRHTIVAPTLPLRAVASTHTPAALPLRLRASADPTPTHISSIWSLEDPFRDQNSTRTSATTSVPWIRSPIDFIFSTSHSIYRAAPETTGTLSRTTDPETAGMADGYHDISPSQARKLRSDLARARAG